MAKRIALICKGKAKDFTKDDGFSELFTLDSNVYEVGSTLEYYGNWKVEGHILKDRNKLEKALIKIQNSNDDLESLLFYYTGHGKAFKKQNFIVGEDYYKVYIML